MRKIEPLDSERHDRDSFDCGVAVLNAYLKTLAVQHGAKGISKTYVLVEEAKAPPVPIQGFFSLTVCQVRSEGLPESIAKKLPRSVPAYKLGRLAVDQSLQGQKLGGVLLAAAFKKVLRAAGEVGGIGLFVDAKDLNARDFYAHFGFLPLADGSLELFLPLKTIADFFKN